MCMGIFLCLVGSLQGMMEDAPTQPNVFPWGYLPHDIRRKILSYVDNEYEDTKEYLINNAGQILRGYTDWVNSVQFNPHNADELASGSRDSTVRIWDLSKRRVIKKWFDEVRKYSVIDPLTSLLICKEVVQAHKQNQPLVLSQKEETCIRMMPSRVKEVLNRLKKEAEEEPKIK